MAVWNVLRSWLIVAIAFGFVILGTGMARAEDSSLQKALDAAGDFARNNAGVGIVIHIGGDFPNEVFETPAQYADALVMVFDLVL